MFVGSIQNVGPRGVSQVYGLGARNMSKEFDLLSEGESTGQRYKSFFFGPFARNKQFNIRIARSKACHGPHNARYPLPRIEPRGGKKTARMVFRGEVEDLFAFERGGYDRDTRREDTILLLDQRTEIRRLDYHS
jgi:hypothetical protein